MSKEALRVGNSQYGGQIIVQLTESEQFIYNLFYASLASALGFVFSSKYVLSNLSRNQTPKRRLYFKKAINDGGFASWSFLSWFGKLGALLGIFYMMFPFQYDIDFLKECPLFLILLPLVLFLSSWTGLRMALGRNSLQTLLLFSLIFGLMSLALSFKDFIDVDSLNESLKRNNLSYPYRLKIPKSRGYELVRNPNKSSLAPIPIYVAKNIEKTEDYKILVGDTKEQVSGNNLIRWLQKERSIFDPAEADRMNLKLYIEESAPMSFVDSLKWKLRTNHFLHINFMVGVKNSKYPSSSPLFKNLGISQWMFPYVAELDSFLYVAEELDFTQKKIIVGKSDSYRLQLLKQYKSIKIRATESGLFVNNRKVNEDQVLQKLKSHIEKYVPNYTIVYSHSQGVSYGKYVETLGLMHYAIDGFRKEMAQRLFQNQFVYLSRDEKSEIKKQYPKSILEWTREEKRLIELLKKQQTVRKSRNPD